MGSRRRAVRFMILLAAALAASTAWAETRVEFKGPTTDGGRVGLTGFLDPPEGAGPCPAVVLMHDASGLGWDLGAMRDQAWAEKLVQGSCVAPRVDSFGPRNVVEMCLVDGQDRPQGSEPFQALVASFPDSPSVIRRQETPLLLLYGDGEEVSERRALLRCRGARRLGRQKYLGTRCERSGRPAPSPHAVSGQPFRSS